MIQRLLAIATLHGQEPDQLGGAARCRLEVDRWPWTKTGEDAPGESVVRPVQLIARGREGLLLRVAATPNPHR